MSSVKQANNHINKETPAVSHTRHQNKSGELSLLFQKEVDKQTLEVIVSRLCNRIKKLSTNVGVRRIDPQKANKNNGWKE